MSADIDYRRILNPSAEQRGRASHVLANLAGRTFWHKLFDNTPSLARALGEDASVAILNGFLADCDAHRVSLDWRMPLTFLTWLEARHPGHPEGDNPHLLECMSAAAAAWAGEVVDVGMHRMILVCSRDQLAVGVMRPQTIDSGSRVFRLQIDTQAPSDSLFQSAVSAHPDRWAVGGWRAVAMPPWHGSETDRSPGPR